MKKHHPIFLIVALLSITVAACGGTTETPPAQIQGQEPELRNLANQQPGYISGETLNSLDDPEEYLVIGTWRSREDWEAWQSNKERVQIQEKVDALLKEKTRYGVYLYG